MDVIDRGDLQWKIAMIYFIPSIGFFIWWLFGQITIASGVGVPSPDPQSDLLRLLLAAISFSIGIIRLRWGDIKYPTLAPK